MEENKGVARYTAKDIISFLIGCIGPYGTVIFYLFVKNLISYGEPFNFQDVVIHQLKEMVPAVLIYGSYFIMPGCLLGEWVYRKFAYRVKYVLGLLIFACIGLIYSILLLLPSYLSDGTVTDMLSVFFLIPIIGAVLFFIFRRKT